MALCMTAQWANAAPQVKLTVEQTSSTNVDVTYTYTLQYIASSAANTSYSKSYNVYIAGVSVKSGSFAIDGKTGTHTICTGTKTISRGETTKTITFSVSFDFELTWSGVYKGTATAAGTISLPALPTFTVSYNANGGSGAPASQTAKAGKVITLSTTIPTRSGYTFKGWNSNSTSSVVLYKAGQSIAVNYSQTLYAVWQLNTYTITYNANGGENAPSKSTKTHGVTLKLSTQKPTRKNYTFLGWSTSQTATTAAYESGANFTTNANTTLYAVWEIAYVNPTISNLSVIRCYPAGTTLGSNPTCFKVTFGWECVYANPTIYITWSSQTGGSGSKETDCTGTSGTFTQIFGDGNLSSEATYTVTIKVQDTVGFTLNRHTLLGTAYGIDFYAEGKGAAFGKPAELEDVLDIGFKTKFTGGIQNIVLEKNTDLNNVLTPNTYVSVNQGASTDTNCPIASGTFVLEVMSSGAEGQVMQRLTSTFKDGAHETYIRHYYQGTWGAWVLVYGDTGWIDLTLQSGITVGTEMGYLKARKKDGVLYIKGDVLGINADWQHFATVPASLCGGLPSSTRFAGVYNMTYFCGFNLVSGGALHVSKNGAGSWNATNLVTINIAICI